MNGKSIVTFGLALGAALSSFAGGSDRGGGNALVCFKSPSSSADILNPANPLRGYILDKHLSDIKSVTTYDLAGMAAKAFPAVPGESHSSYIERVAKRFEVLLPDLSKFLREVNEGIFDENITMNASPLYRMYDENDAGPMNPESCVISTMAVQADVGSETQLTIDERLFNHPTHAELSKHALYLHEYLYRVFRGYRFNDKDSSRTRAVVQIILENNVPLDRIQTKLENVVGTYIAPGDDQLRLGRGPIDQFLENILVNPGLLESIQTIDESARLDLISHVRELQNIVQGNVSLHALLEQLEVPKDGKFRLDVGTWAHATNSLRYFPKSGLDHEPDRQRFIVLTHEIREKIGLIVGKNIRPKLIAMAKSGVVHVPVTNEQKANLIQSIAATPSRALYCLVARSEYESHLCYKAKEWEKHKRSMIQKLGIKL